MSLEEFVKQSGSQERAAHIIGVSFTTVSAWMRGKKKPSSLAIARFKDLGISWGGDENETDNPS